MRTTETREIGSIYTLSFEERETLIDLGNQVRLESTWVTRKRGTIRFRSWYVLGDSGMVRFSVDSEKRAQAACLAWLAANGYTADGALPPECFEYTLH